jgi:hypothetical protein
MEHQQNQIRNWKSNEKLNKSKKPLLKLPLFLFSFSRNQNVLTDFNKNSKYEIYQISFAWQQCSEGTDATETGLLLALRFAFRTRL